MENDNYTKHFTPTALLKANGSTMTAREFNRRAVAAGLLFEDSRPSTKHVGEVRKFLKLTDAGLKFGVNDEDERGTITARWRENTFGEVLKLIEVKK